MMRTLTLIALAFVAGCSQAPRYAQDALLPATHATPAALQEITVHRRADCHCCAKWIDHLRAAGFAVRVHNVEDMTPIKDRLGVPASQRTCHTAEVGGYFIEGHVPAADIRLLLATHPKARGLALPGMPVGAPGMDEGGTQAPYTVELVASDGETTPFASH